MIQELYDLNEKFYNILCRLDLYSEKISAEMFADMQKKIAEQYQDEFTLAYLRAQINYETEIFRLREQAKHLIPQKKHIWWLFGLTRKNEIAKLYEEIIANQAQETLDELEKLLPTDPPDERGTSCAETP